MSRLRPLLAALVLLPAAGMSATGATGATGASAQAQWSAPATLNKCPVAGAAQAVFPKDSPTHATGRGAVVWSTSSRCPAGEATLTAAIGANDVPRPGAYALAPGGRKLELRAPLAATGAPHGQLAIAGSQAPGGRGGTVLQGSSGGPFSTLARTAGVASAGALATGYLGDVGVASPVSGRGGLQVRIERYFAHDFSAPLTVAAAAPGPVRALTLAMDYRTDTIAVWQQAGAIYARDLPASGTPHATQRLAAAASVRHISALISDNNRAIVVWAQEQGSQTSVYLDQSATGVVFGKPRLLERFANPGGLHSPAASPRLVRLSSESVMLAWSGAEHDRWVLRTAPIDLRGLQAVSTISAPGGDALLADLEPGPDGEALALWSEPQRTADGLLQPSRQAIYAARGIDAAPGRTIFSRPEQIAAPGPNSDATVAFDPASDRALALWRGSDGTLQYAVRSPSAP